MQSELVYNQWFGKAVGFTSAFVFAPDDPIFLSLSVITGVAGGHLFDLWAQKNDPKPTFNIPRAARGAGFRSEPHQNAQMQFLFSAMGHLAKRSGVVTSHHVKYTENLIKQLDLSASHRTQAIAWFTAGKSQNFPFTDLHRRAGALNESLQVFMARCLTDLAAIKPTDPVLQRTVELATLFGIPVERISTEFDRALKLFNPRQPNNLGSKNRKESDAAQSKPANPRAEAYAVLRIKPGATEAEIKKAYRRLVSRHHPDKLPPNAPAAQKQKSERKMVELREALETLQAR